METTTVTTQQQQAAAPAEEKKVTMAVDLSQMTEAQKAALREQLNAEAKSSRQENRKAYEDLRHEFMVNVENQLGIIVKSVKQFKDWLGSESDAFTKIMQRYGQTKFDDQKSFTITDGDFRLSIASNNVKSFDERADLAADRLIKYLKRYMEQSKKGQEDPMYQLAMTLLERNNAGDLDYKSISKLYELEDKFDEEYADIMTLFKESNVVQKTAVNFYFFKRSQESGIWTRIEPSFCRL